MGAFERRAKEEKGKMTLLEKQPLLVTQRGIRTKLHTNLQVKPSVRQGD